MVAHPVSLYGFLTGVVTLVCVTALAITGHADENVLVVLSTIGGAGIGVAGGVAYPKGTNGDGDG